MNFNKITQNRKTQKKKTHVMKTINLKKTIQMMKNVNKNNMMQKTIKMLNQNFVNQHEKETRQQELEYSMHIYTTQMTINKSIVM